MRSAISFSVLLQVWLIRRAAWALRSDGIQSCMSLQNRERTSPPAGMNETT